MQSRRCNVLQQLGADNREWRNDDRFSRAEDTVWEYTSSRIIYLSLSSFPLTRSLAKSHLATDRSHRSQKRENMLISYKPNRYRSILTDAAQIFLESLYQISLAKCRKITLIESWSHYINNITAYIPKLGNSFFCVNIFNTFVLCRVIGYYTTFCVYKEFT